MAIRTDFTDHFLSGFSAAIDRLDKAQIDEIVEILVTTKKTGGRIFFTGVGGGAGNANHAVCDFRKLAGIECYAISDNVSELTARVNDDGWETCYVNWLKVSKFSQSDCLFVFSVGGGNVEHNVSANIVESLKLAKQVKASIVGGVGRDGGYTAQVANACVVVPTISSENVTPYTESMQVLIWHLIVTHPNILSGQMKW